MKYYVGIDLGTTNSAISSFDGENVRVWKSKKDQNDVTPSAIYVDKRGKRFYGKEAYLKNSQQPQRCAVLLCKENPWLDQGFREALALSL